MAFNLDPANFLGNAIEGLISAPVIIGLSSKQFPTPQFVIGIMPDEEASTSITLPAFQLAAGDLFMKSALEPGRYKFSLVLSQDPMLAKQWIPLVSAALQQISGIANTIGSFGSVLPNLAGTTSNYAVAQLKTLNSIKNNAQPVLILNSVITLGSISQSNPYLSSNWYIESIQLKREESDGGAVVDVSLREILVKRNPAFGAGSLITNFANEIIGPGVGNSIASLFP